MALERVPTDVLGDDLIATYERGIRRLELAVRSGLEAGLDPARVGGLEQVRGDATLAYRDRQLRVSRAIVSELRAGALESPIIARQAYESALYAVDSVTLGAEGGVSAAAGARFGGVHQRALVVVASNMSTSLERAAALVGENVEAVFARASAIEGALPVRGRASGFIGRRRNDPWRNVALGSIGEGLVTLDTRKQVSAAYVRRLIDSGVTDALTGFVDAAGRRWDLRTYAETVVRTTTREATSRATANRLRENGHSLVTISSHPHAADECSPYDGKTFALELGDDSSGYPLLDVLPPFHPRCRHVLTPAADTFEAFERELGVGTARSQETPPEAPATDPEAAGTPTTGRARARRAARQAAATPPTPARPTPALVDAADKIKAGGTFTRQLVEDVAPIIARVHKVPGDMDVGTRGRNVGRGRLAVRENTDRSRLGGYAFYKAADDPLEITVTLDDQKEATLVHELGHFIDHKGLHPAERGFSSEATSGQVADDMAELHEAIDNSRHVADLKRVAETGRDVVQMANGELVEVNLPTSQKKHITKYLLDPSELFARAYYQWITKRTGDATLRRQLEVLVARIGGRFHTQWDDDDFEPVAAALDRLFKNRGLIE